MELCFAQEGHHHFEKVVGSNKVSIISHQKLLIYNENKHALSQTILIQIQDFITKKINLKLYFIVL